MACPLSLQRKEKRRKRERSTVKLVVHAIPKSLSSEGYRSNLDKTVSPEKGKMN